MRELLNQDRALSPAAIKLGMNVLGLLFAIAAVIITLYGMLTIFGSGAFLIGLLQISAGIGFLLAVFMIVRLQAESVMAAHRMNDRLMILSDALSPRIAAKPANAPAKAKKPAPAKAKTQKAKAPATDASSNSKSPSQ